MTLTICELLCVYTCRSEHFTLAKIGVFSNRMMNLATLKIDRPAPDSFRGGTIFAFCQTFRGKPPGFKTSGGRAAADEAEVRC